MNNESYKHKFLTVNQVAHLAACRPQSVNTAVASGRLKEVYPFPDGFDKSETGPKFIAADKKLQEFLLLRRGHAGLVKGNTRYNPLVVVSKYCEWEEELPPVEY